jgi:DHA3 family macrolide efflux protein-like MFS transporter
MNRNFILLWQGQFVSQAGVQIAYVGTMLWVYAATGSATFMGLLLMASSIPGVILGPIGGTFADRYSRKSIIVMCDLLKGLAVCGFAAMLFMIPEAVGLKLTVLFCLAIFNGIVNAFFGPAITAAIPDLVPRDKLAGANSLIQSSGQIASFIGQGVGGVLYRFLGAPMVFLIDGLSYLFSSGSETFIHLPHRHKKDKLEINQLFRVFKEETLEGFRYIWKNSGVKTTVLIAAFLNFFLAPIFVLMPVFVKEFLEAKDDWYGYILAGLGAGALVGYIVAGTVRRTGIVRVVTHLIFLISFSACFIVLSFIRTEILALVLMFICGMFVGVVQVDLSTILQMGVPSEIRGRVFGFMGTLSAGLMPIAMGLSGVIADALDGNIPVIYLTCGILLVLISTFAAFKSEFRKFLATE